MYDFSHTHTGRLLHALQKVPGRDEEVGQTLEAVSVVTTLDDLEELAEDSRGRDLKRWVEGGQTALDRRVQGLGIL